jgi:hypothetical protein
LEETSREEDQEEEEASAQALVELFDADVVLEFFVMTFF